MQQKICCGSLQALVEDPECYVKYIPYRREYVIVMPDYYLNRSKLCMSFPIGHCPWCGAQLPKNLSHEWYAIIQEKFDIGDCVETEIITNLSEEFKTDEWWKKRKL